MKLTAFSILLSLARVVSAQSAVAPETAAGDSRFDGTWNVVLVCETHPDGAFGYTFEFPAVVKEGRLRGEHGQAGRPSWLLLEGTIPTDGNAMLRAKGLTGQQKYIVGNGHSLLPYAYRVSAHFDPATGQGSGKRIELRACAFTFSKAP